jgi:hypothetical protein
MTEKPDYIKVMEEYFEKNKPPTLWDIMRNELGYSVDCCDEIVDAVENKWLPKESEGSIDVLQWNKCVRMMREKLR